MCEEQSPFAPHLAPLPQFGSHEGGVHCPSSTVSPPGPHPVPLWQHEPAAQSPLAPHAAPSAQ
jgi:hypothetical protein